MNVIWSLCRKYTDLSDEEIRIIEHMSETLQPLANLEGADIFIDCPGRDGNAIVVAEAKPECVPSSYKNTVVGLLAKPENEPAVARTFRLGVGTKQMKAVTQENDPVGRAHPQRLPYHRRADPGEAGGRAEAGQ